MTSKSEQVAQTDCSVHVIPLNDFREHESSKHCWCKPEEDESNIWVHNALDGREKIETGERMVQ